MSSFPTSRPIQAEGSPRALGLAHRREHLPQTDSLGEVAARTALERFGRGRAPRPRLGGGT